LSTSSFIAVSSASSTESKKKCRYDKHECLTGTAAVTCRNQVTKRLATAAPVSRAAYGKRAKIVYCRGHMDLYCITKMKFISNFAPHTWNS